MTRARSSAPQSNPAATLYKSGVLVCRESSSPSPGKGGSYRFVMSSESVDSYGDIVKQNWDFSRFRQNPIALWRHDTECPIGTWSDYGVTRANGKPQLEGTLTMAAPGSSEEVDMVESLLSQRVLRMVSVGFRSRAPMPIDPQDPWGGYTLDDNLLLECSVTALGANEDALYQETKEFRNGRVIQEFLAKSAEIHIPGSAASIYRKTQKPQASGVDPTSTFVPKETRAMSLADRIRKLETDIVSTKDQIAALVAADDLSPEIQETLDDLNGTLASQTKSLETLRRTEATLAQAVIGSQPAETRADETGAPVPRITIRQQKQKGSDAFTSLACIVKGLGLRQDPVAVARDLVKDRQEIEHIVRAATAPAITTGSTWATNLMQQTWGEMLELLRDVSVYPLVPGMRVDLSGQHNIPVQNGRGALAAGFIAENGAIPVKEGSIGTTSLSPKKLGIISAFSKELARRSIPSIESVIRDQFLRDTAEGLDTAFLSTTARSASAAAGLRDTTETGAANINAVTNAATGAGNCTVKEILADTRALLGRVWAIKAGRNNGGVWLMNPAQVIALADKQDGTTGQFVFREEVNGGMFRGFPIVESTNVTAGVVAFVAGNTMAFGSEVAPYFEMSDQATLHFEGASPTAIGTAGTPNTVAAPVYSLYQQDMFAIKGIWILDWRILRAAGVQVLTSADGW